MDKNFTESMIKSLANIPIPSTEHMSDKEKIGGVAQMIEDLERLAQKDGCIAAGWVLEVLAEVVSEEEENQEENPYLLNSGDADQLAYLRQMR